MLAEAMAPAHGDGESGTRAGAFRNGDCGPGAAVERIGRDLGPLDILAGLGRASCGAVVLSALSFHRDDLWRTGRSDVRYASRPSVPVSSLAAPGDPKRRS